MPAITPFRLRFSACVFKSVIVEPGVLNRAVNIRELGDSANETQAVKEIRKSDDSQTNSGLDSGSTTFVIRNQRRVIVP